MEQARSTITRRISYQVRAEKLADLGDAYTRKPSGSGDSKNLWQAYGHTPLLRGTGRFSIQHQRSTQKSCCVTLFSGLHRLTVPNSRRSPDATPMIHFTPHQLYERRDVKIRANKSKKKKGEKKIFHDKATIWHMPSPWKICVDRYRVWALCEEHHVQTTQRSPFPRGGPSEEMVHPTSHMLCKVRYTPQ